MATIHLEREGAEVIAHQVVDAVVLSAGAAVGRIGGQTHGNDRRVEVSFHGNSFDPERGNEGLLLTIQDIEKYISEVLALDLGNGTTLEDHLDELARPFILLGLEFLVKEHFANSPELLAENIQRIDQADTRLGIQRDGAFDQIRERLGQSSLLEFAVIKLGVEKAIRTLSIPEITKAVLSAVADRVQALPIFQLLQRASGDQLRQLPFSLDGVTVFGDEAGIVIPEESRELVVELVQHPVLAMGVIINLLDEQSLKLLAEAIDGASGGETNEHWQAIVDTIKQNMTGG